MCGGGGEVRPGTPNVHRGERAGGRESERRRTRERGREELSACLFEEKKKKEKKAFDTHPLEDETSRLVDYPHRVYSLGEPRRRRRHRSDAAPVSFDSRLFYVTLCCSHSTVQKLFRSMALGRSVMRGPYFFLVFLFTSRPKPIIRPDSRFAVASAPSKKKAKKTINHSPAARHSVVPASREVNTLSWPLKAVTARLQS